jgi:anaerobic magnesium-protoporphyrin IX monomethyl ester cyclase
MKVTGCIHLAWGLESGCQRVLELMNKRFFDMELAKKVIVDTYEVGINQSISLIAGFPGETEEMFGETLVFLREYRRYFSKVSVQPMMIVNNSLVYEKYQQYGIDYANSRDGLKWKSIDGSNNYEMRLERVEQLKSLLKDKIITIDK